jgi:hypothetical protein
MKRPLSYTAFENWTVGDKERKELTNLYDSAIFADDIYSAALRNLYGAKASEMRYKPAKHPEILALRAKKAETYEAWLEAYRRSLKPAARHSR